jgi:hypothetical protein
MATSLLSAQQPITFNTKHFQAAQPNVSKQRMGLGRVVCALDNQRIYVLPAILCPNTFQIYNSQWL